MRERGEEGKEEEEEAEGRGNLVERADSSEDEDEGGVLGGECLGYALGEGGRGSGVGMGGGDLGDGVGGIAEGGEGGG